MNESTITQAVLFSDLVDRPLTASFDQPHASSGGGAILLKAADRHVGLLAALTATVPDARASARVTHSVGALVAQRVFAIAAGLQILELAQTAYSSYVAKNPHEQARLVKTVVSNSTFDRGSLCPIYVKPFDVFANGGKTGDWLLRLDSNQQPSG